MNEDLIKGNAPNVEEDGKAAAIGMITAGLVADAEEAGNMVMRLPVEETLPITHSRKLVVGDEAGAIGEAVAGAPTSWGCK